MRCARYFNRWTLIILRGLMKQGKARIDIDGRWQLEDFGVFSKQYTQSYSLIYSLTQNPNETKFESYRFRFEYSKYPWRGGFSVINFYYSLYARIPNNHKPEVSSIRYSSPGSIELSTAVEVSAQLGAIITVIAVSLNRVNNLYNNIQKGIRERKLGRIEVAAKELQLDQATNEWITSSIAEIVKAMRLSNELLETLELRTEGNKLVQLKVLLSLYRRLEPIAELVEREMLRFNDCEEPPPSSTNVEKDQQHNKADR